MAPRARPPPACYSHEAMTRAGSVTAPRSFLAGALLIAVLISCACSDRPSVAARATVQTFYSAIQVDNVPVVDDNLAADASPQFRAHVQAATLSAQSDGEAQRAVTLVRVDTPAIHGATANVHVVFADGGADTVSLVAEGLRWKVVSSGRLGS
jgi:hypothetical protein